MTNDPYAYLGKFMSTSNIAKGAERPKVKVVGMKVQRPPEMNVHAGPGKGLGEGNRPIKGTGEKRYGPPPKGVMNGDGWKDKKNTPSRSGPETGPSQGFDSPGDKKAKPLGKKGVETQSPKVEKKKGLAKHANIEGNESARYEKLEKKSLRSLKGGGTEKELRAGHNQGGTVPGMPATPKTVSGVRANAQTAGGSAAPSGQAPRQERQAMRRAMRQSRPVRGRKMRGMPAM